MKMILTGGRMNAQRASQLGVVQDVYPTVEELHKK